MTVLEKQAAGKPITIPHGVYKVEYPKCTAILDLLILAADSTSEINSQIVFEAAQMLRGSLDRLFAEV